jgi:hypothetical protein
MVSSNYLTLVRHFFNFFIQSTNENYALGYEQKELGGKFGFTVDEESHLSSFHLASKESVDYWRVYNDLLIVDGTHNVKL